VLLLTDNRATMTRNYEPTGISECVHRARERLRAEDGRVPLAAIAHEARLSVGELIRRFAAVFGETPHRYRSRERLARAKALLARRERSITEVCMDVGFSSLGSFSAWFTRGAGVAPTVYRSRVRAFADMPASSPESLHPGCMSLLEGALAQGMVAASAISEKRHDVRCQQNAGNESRGSV
jgi:AraC-like DNA-binding protein